MKKTTKKSKKKVGQTIAQAKKSAVKSRGTGKRRRVDSAEEAVEIAQNAFREIEPPAHIRMDKTDLIFFDSVLAEFPNAEWSDHQLEVAAMLARAMADMEEQQYMLRKEGHMIEIKTKEKKNSKKPQNTYLIANPRKQMVRMCSTDILAMRRTLSLHARARAGEGRDIGKRRAMQKEIERGVHALDDDDDLISRPRQTH